MDVIDVKAIIDRFYPNDDELKRIYLVHARKVAELAMELADAHQIGRAHV